MKKRVCLTLSVIFIALISFILSSCNSNTNETKYVFEKTNDFNDVVKFNDELDLTGITLKNKAGKEKEVTNELITSGGETNSVGKHQATLSYEDETLTIEYTVKYEVVFKVDSSIYDTQLVLNKDEIVLPKDPVKEGYDFIGWSWGNQIPELTDNVEISAVFTLTKDQIPAIDSVIEVSYGTSLEDIKLPSNEYGKWEFVDTSIKLGDAGSINQIEVKLVPTDNNLAEVNRNITIKVNKQKVNIEVFNTNLIYNGEEQLPEYKLPAGLEGLNVISSTPNKLPGEYEYTFKINDKNYEGTISGKYHIDKKKITINIPNIEVYYGDVVKVVDNQILVNDKPVAEVTYDGEFIEGEYVNIEISAPLSLEAGETSFNIKIDESSQYYNNYDYKINLGVITVNKDLPNPVLPNINGIYGQKLEDVTIEQSDSLGVFTFKDPSIVLSNAGEFKTILIFTPHNSNYETIEVEVVINVNKKKVNITVSNLEFIYNAQIQKPMQYVINGIIDGDATPKVINNTDDNINVGTYEYSFVIEDTNYEGEITGSYEIKPKEVTITGKNMQMKFNETIPTWEYEISGLIDGDDLNLTITNPKYDKIGTYYYEVSHDNDNYNVIVKNNELVVVKGDYNDLKLPTVKNPVVEAKLGDLQLESTETRGKYEYLNPEEVLKNAGVNTIEIKFISSDGNYNDQIISIEINVAKKDISDYISVDGLNVIYDGTAHEPSISIQEPYNNIEYVLTIDEAIDVNNYDFTITINDANYTGSYSGTLVIEKASIPFEKPVITEQYWNTDINSIEIERIAEGSFEIVSSGKIEVGTNSIEVKFIPDNKNYKEEIFTVEVIGVKRDANITAKEENLILSYNGQAQDISTNFTLNHSEATLEFTYKLEGEEVDSIKNVGTYTVVVSAKETEHYNAVSKEYQVVVNVSAPTDVKQAVYGQKLSEIFIADDANGTWAWENPDQKLNFVGEREFKAIFTSKDGQNVEEFMIKINVSKLDISDDIVVDQTKFDYTGYIITLTAKLTGKYDLDLELVYENNKYTNVGEYKAIITVADNKYYTGSKEVEWKINSIEYSDLIRPTFGDAYYLDYLKDLEFNADADSRGKYELVNPDLQIDVVGKYTITLKFKPNDPNVLESTVEIEINVSKRNISDSIIISSEELTYNAQTQQVSPSIEGYDGVELEISAGFVDAGTYNYSIDVKENAYFEGHKEGTYTINPANVVIDVLDKEVVYSPDLALDNKDFEVQVLSGEFYNTDKEQVIVSVDNANILANGYGKYPLTITFDNNNYNLSYDTQYVNVIRKYDYSSISISKAMQDSDESKFNPIYGANGLVLGFLMNGTYNEGLNINDFDIILSQNGVSKKVLTLVDNVINGYYFTLDISGFTTETEVILTIKLKEAPKEVYDTIKIKVNPSLNNISTITEAKPWNITGSSALNNDLVYNPNGTTGYSFVDNRLVYTSTYTDGAANGDTGLIILKDATLYGNGYKIDGSLLDVENSGSSKSFVNTVNANINNIELKLGIASTYDRAANFNIGSAVISNTGQTTISNSYINGGVRGIRIQSNLTLNNVRFRNNVIALEVYSGESASSYDVYLNDVEINAFVEQNGQEVISKTLGVMFFPGSKGVGVNNFHLKKIHFNGFYYNGWTNLDEAVNLVNTLLVGAQAGIGLVKIGKDDIEPCFDNNPEDDNIQTTININDVEMVNLAVVVPSYMKVMTNSGTLSAEFTESNNLAGIYSYKKVSANKNAFIAKATLDIYLYNVADETFDYNEHFVMDGDTVVSIKEIADFVFSY